MAKNSSVHCVQTLLAFPLLSPSVVPPLPSSFRHPAFYTQQEDVDFFCLKKKMMTG